MSMFLSKLLSGRSNSKTKLELLSEAWTSIQKYYETAADPLKDAVELTPIPTCLQNIIKLIQTEELEFERATNNLETGPCLEYVLQKRVLEELAEFAKVDTPFGMRVQCLRFFCSLVTNVHAQLLPERAVHVPLQKLITSCHRLITHHYEQLANDPDACSDERHAAIAELSLELVKLMHGIFSHFKGANAALMDLFFERGWCRGHGEHVWRSSSDGRTLHKRPESMDDKMAWNMFLTPRFDMFTYLIDLMNIPGETGEIARESILFALRLLEGDPEYVCYVVEYSGLCETMAERLAVYYASLPKNIGTFSILATNRVIPVKPGRHRVRFCLPSAIIHNSLMITVNTQNSFKKKRRKRSPFDVNFLRLVESSPHNSRVDQFFSFWEYLNDVARVADKRLMTALMAQLTTLFWHPVVCVSLCSPSRDAAAAATAYTTEMVRSLTDQKLLQSFIIVLIGEDGGTGKDLEPEIRKVTGRYDEWSDEDQEHEDGDDDDNSSGTAGGQGRNVAIEKKQVEDLTLRTLLISRIDIDHQDLAMSSLRFFDTLLETYNQFAIYNLVLRNYVNTNTNDDQITLSSSDDKEGANNPSSDPLSSDETATSTDTSRTSNETDEATEGHLPADKVRWLVERILSLLPLQDDLERTKSPPIPSVLSHDPLRESQGHDAHGEPDGRVIPGHSYDDYFHEARERFEYGMLARNFWQMPYPPRRRRSEVERPKKRSSTINSLDTSRDSDRDRDMEDRGEAYEGMFLARIFDRFFHILEHSLEQNLLVTSILQKIASVVDPRVDRVICDWHAIRVGGDGSLYGGVWTLPTAKGNRRSLYSLLEQVTFEALKRAQLVPNFEPRISLAKKRGLLPGPNAASGQPLQQPHALFRSASSLTMKGSRSAPREAVRQLSHHPSLSQLFGKTSASTTVAAGSSPHGVPPSSTPVPTRAEPQRASTDSTRRRPPAPTVDTTNLPPSSGENSTPSSAAAFFQQSRSNATPITMTNPFAKLSDFVTSYIVLQEFCKELAAVILVRHATNFSHLAQVQHHRQSTVDFDLPMGTDHWTEEGDDGKRMSERWRNRASVVSMADWRSVRSLDTIDEAITARVPPSSTSTTIV